MILTDGRDPARIGNDPERDRQTIAVLEAATAAVQGLSAAWRHESRLLVEADGEYPPEQIDWLVRNWTQLRAAAEGGTVSYEGGPGGGGQGRLGIAVMLADVEQAMDLVLRDRMHWRCVQRVYDRQSRDMPAWRRTAGAPLEPDYPYGYWTCVDLVARALGWQGYQEAA